jgi:crotonobetainyl-CoA:carnitine CoA-transferase CaiB-like acyl-CoA transferase
VAFLTGRQHGPSLLPPGSGATRARELVEYLGLDLDGAALLAERAALTGWTRRGAVSVGGSCRLLPTADGWAAVSCARADDPLLLGALIGAALPADPWPQIAAWLRRHPGAELAERAELLGVAAYPVLPGAGGGADPDWVGRLRRSLDGLLVVDFSALWAGPLCAHLLGLLGARVVKVETPTRPDGARSGNPDFYRLLHAGHESVVAEPQTDGRFLRALVEAADVIVEASRPRALAAWGLGPDCTDATWVSITAAGRRSNRVGFGDDIAAGAGLVAADERGPVFVGDAIADPLAGITAAARAVAAAPGALVEIDMTAVVAATLEEAPETPAAGATQPRAGEAPRSPLARNPSRPRAREIRGEAPPSGAHTDAVRRELGC